MKPIMDVSRWQGSIDWDKVKASGLVSGVMLRALGNSDKDAPSKPYIDPTFERNYRECKRLGIPCGAYYYCKAVNTAEADAELAMLHGVLSGKVLGLPVAVDIEDAALSKLGKQTLTDLTAYALNEIQSWGVYAILYTGLNFAQNHLYMTGAALKPFDVWLAAYRSTKPEPGWPFGMWQYTSRGKIPGVVDAIPGKVSGVDLSHAYKDYTKIIAKKGLTRLREGK